jgi:hypothetical protein
MGTWWRISSKVVCAFGASIALVAASSAPAAAYPPGPPVPGEPSLDVTAFSPVCIADAPYIEYAIVPIGFSSRGPATLTIRNKTGRIVEVVTVDTLSGRIPYPGAKTSADGSAIDWPGWRFEGGMWVEDPRDAILREGLSITVVVNPTAVATVEYPDATSECAGPSLNRSAPPGTPSAALPTTGTDISTAVPIALATLGAGLAAATAARVRRSRTAALE